ncbi:MAG: MerR family transcriptional regulator [Oscillibacter ruminantium]|uniref:MerR family transcriptional regulator n=1 Tax=Oscillibacter ruminantium TaxID=1263547 RepID=UPI002B205665|nr:MerR family transcriptional regulator [Oscillibacter ruminantium]MEA5042898.1 MerR family transcriptional regulator [Oscillibacter ruminantium]
MKINEVAKRTGITVRTLHYYDQIGLLKPSRITEAGYRLYDRESLAVLQQILFFRELDFPLQEIREIMENPGYNRQEALEKHRELLVKKRERLNGLIGLVDKTLKGESEMSFQEFDKTEIETMREQYAKEVRDRWGDTPAFQEEQKKTARYDGAKWNAVNDEGAALMRAFAEHRDESPSDGAAQELVRQWREYITENFYHCTDEILAGLGAMYVSDPRFTENIDKNGPGTAAFMAKAIEASCRK